MALHFTAGSSSADVRTSSERLPQKYKQIALEQDGTDLISYRLRVPALSTWIDQAPRGG